MFEENMIVQLKGIGMSEYESKVYLTLICINSASPRELHETTNIPRGRVYETLTNLEKKGFIISNRQSPVRYRVADIPHTVERLKQEAVTRYDMLGIALETYAALTCTDQLGQTYTIQSKWGIENHIRFLLKTAKNELLIISDDPAFYQYFAEELSQVVKRVTVNSVVSNKKTAKKIPFPCYLADKDTKESLFQPPILRKMSLPTKVAIYADRKEVLAVYEREGKKEAVFTRNNIYADFITRTVMRNQVRVSP
jgi:sugar-specific transcriptional regulator TrmB